MILFGDRVVCCTDDLVRAARCEFALLRAFDAELGIVADAAEPASGLPLGSRPWAGEPLSGGTARWIEVPESRRPTRAELAAAHEATLTALRDGDRTIARATFFDGSFAAGCARIGRAETDGADALILHGHRATTETAALLELSACAILLRDNGFRVAQQVHLHLGDGTERRYDLAHALPVQAASRSRVSAIIGAKQDELLPVQWGDRRYPACGRCASCLAEMAAARDLTLIAGMRPSVRGQLRAAGITTIDRLAQAEAPAGIPGQTFAALRQQAELLVRGERTGQGVYAVTDAGAFGDLSPADSGDVFLAVEGAEVGVGVRSHGADDVLLFHAFTTADPIALLEFLADRLQRHPGLRIYHYRTEIRDLMAALCAHCGADEETTAELLDALLDLYPIVRSALLIGARTLTLSAILGALDPQGPALVPGLENTCAGTLRLRDRLAALAGEHDIAPHPAAAHQAAEQPAAVEDALREFAFDYDESRSPAQLAAAWMAAVLGYPRRERRPLHSAHEDRLRLPIGEWSDTPGVLVADWSSIDTKWQHTDDHPMRRYLTVTGRLGTGIRPSPGTPVRTLYDIPVADLAALPGRHGTAAATVLGCALDDDFDDVIRVEELLAPGATPHDELPTAIVPEPPARQENLRQTLAALGHQLLASLPDIPRTAAFDLLCRRPPRLRSGTELPQVRGDHAAAITTAVTELDSSYVAVQGPSGTGRTDTTGRVIERLVTRQHWRIGVVARSHTAVETVLDEVVRMGVLPELVAKSEVQTVAAEWLAITPERYPRFLDNAVNGCVIGGLPADFTDPGRVAPGSLDLLVLADAGQFPLAQAVAVATAARNLLVVGDPAPLPTAGAHPEPVHNSALGHLVGENVTLPADFGYFLERTWRMHPSLCDTVSTLRYGKRLRSNETITLARELDDVAPGVRAVAVEHYGNSIESAEEAQEIVRQVRTLLGRTWRQGASSRPLHPHDILVVTPYHRQVARIRAQLSRARIEDVVVGTPDRLRGREAAVVLISMTTSTPGQAPHGIAALLSRHWLTGAISRAMWAVIIVASPLLPAHLPETADRLPDLAAYLELTADRAN
ncbi:MAG: hypothetical protein J2P18_03795 [Nocardia sp.]|nr:hypothetical protein [Nocardia sp.]